MFTHANKVIAAGCLLAILSIGCRTRALPSARNHYHAGRLEQAEQQLEKLPSDSDKDKVLYLMERGAVHQARNDLEASTQDWLQAVDLIKRSEPYSVSRGAVSLIINDETLTFRGLPYERTLLRGMLAQNFLLRGQWQSAAVEARNIIENLENLDGFPDDAFSRYVAGFCLEMVNDREGAALQYRTADALLGTLTIDDRSGRLRPADDSDVTTGEVIEQAPDDMEWIVFVLLGRGPGAGAMWRGGARKYSSPGHVEFFNGDGFLARSHPFSDTGALLDASLDRVAALQLAKDVTRIVVKETIVQTLLREHEGLGILASILLYSLEGPDTRRWETLPRSFQVARFSAPTDLDRINLVTYDSAGVARQTRTLMPPFTENDGKIFMMYRDHPPFPPYQSVINGKD